MKFNKGRSSTLLHGSVNQHILTIWQSGVSHNVLRPQIYGVKMKWSTSIMFLSTDQSRLILEIRPKRKTLLFPEMRVTKRNLHPGGCKFILLFDLIDFFLNLHLKNYSNKNSMENNSNWKTRNPTFYCWKKKKGEFVRINLLVENLTANSADGMSFIIDWKFNH